MRFCANCGKDLPDDARFCVQCGLPVVYTATKPYRLVTKPETRTARNIVVAVLLIAVLLIAVVLIVGVVG